VITINKVAGVVGMKEFIRNITFTKKVQKFTTCKERLIIGGRTQSCMILLFSLFNFFSSFSPKEKNNFANLTSSYIFFFIKKRTVCPHLCADSLFIHKRGG